MAMWIKGSNNLIPFPYSGKVSESGITFSANNDGSITLNGKNNGNYNSAFYLIRDNPFILKAGTYYCSIGGSTEVQIVLFDGSNYKAIHNKKFTLEEDTTIEYLYLQVVKGNDYSFDNVKVYPMLNKGETALPYQPYYPARKVKAVFKSKNLIPFPYLKESQTINGITYTVNNDGSVHVKGSTTEKEATFVIANYNVLSLLTGKTYSISGGKGDIVVNARRFTADGTNKWWIESNRPTGQLEDGETFNYVGVYVGKNKTVDETIYPMLNEGEPLPYEPYFPLTKFKAIPKSRNLLPYPYYVFINGNSVYEANGITYTLLADGGIYAKGTATASAYCSLAGQGVFDLGDTIVAAEGETVKTNGDFTLSKYGSAAKDITLAFDSNNKTLWLRVFANRSIDGVVYPMLNKGKTAFPYEPPQEYWK